MSRRIHIRMILQHELNELHLYCRFIECGLSCRLAMKLAHLLGLFLNRIAYKGGVK